MRHYFITNTSLYTVNTQSHNHAQFTRAFVILVTLEQQTASESRPDPTIREQNHLLLESTFLHLPCTDRDDDEDDHLEGPPLSVQRRIEASEYLLSIDNDRWCSDRIVHWCKMGCCGSAKESKLKLWVAIQE